MHRPARIPFVQNDRELLWVSQAAQRFGCRPSELLKIPDETQAFDFDLACSLRLAQFENERDFKRFKLEHLALRNDLRQVINELFGGKPEIPEKLLEDTDNKDNETDEDNIL